MIAWRLLAGATNALLLEPRTRSLLIFVGVLGIRAGIFAFASDQLGVVLLEAIGNVFKEDETKNDVLVLRRVHVGAELVRGEPEFGFEADGGGGVGVD